LAQPTMNNAVMERAKTNRRIDLFLISITPDISISEYSILVDRILRKTLGKKNRPSGGMKNRPAKQVGLFISMS
jgi:hypothetical protein